MIIYKASNPKSCRVCLNDTEAVIREHLRTGRPCEHPECPLHNIINEALRRRKQQPRIIVHQAQKPKILIGNAQKNKKKNSGFSLKQYIKDFKVALNDLLNYFETTAKRVKNIMS